MWRMTVRKSCHGVCNLEACFFGGDLHGWWKLRALHTKTGRDFVSPPPKLVEIFVSPHQNWWRFSCLFHQNWWRFRVSPTKIGGDFVSPHQNWNFDLPHTDNTQPRRRQIRLMAAASHTFKKTRPPNTASPVLVHDEVGFDRPSISHVLVCLIDFIQRIAVREDLARIDLTVKDRLQQDFLVIGRH